jgi:hypothetical protein
MGATHEMEYKARQDCTKDRSGLNLPLADFLFVARLKVGYLGKKIFLTYS